MNTRNLITAVILAIVMAILGGTTVDDNLFGLVLILCVGGWFGTIFDKQGASFVEVIILCTLAIIMSVGIYTGLVLANAYIT